MSKVGIFAVALFFLLLAGASLYRLLFGYPMTIGGVHVGQTASFLAFVICAALSIILFRSGSVER